MCIERTVINGLHKNKYECECVYIPFTPDSSVHCSIVYIDICPKISTNKQTVLTTYLF